MTAQTNPYLGRNIVKILDEVYAKNLYFFQKVTYLLTLPRSMGNLPEMIYFQFWQLQKLQLHDNISLTYDDLSRLVSEKNTITTVHFSSMH